MSFQIGNKAACKPVRTTNLTARVPEALATKARFHAAKSGLKLNRWLWNCIEKAVAEDGKS